MDSPYQFMQRGRWISILGFFAHHGGRKRQLRVLHTHVNAMTTRDENDENSTSEDEGDRDNVTQRY